MKMIRNIIVLLFVVTGVFFSIRYLVDNYKAHLVTLTDVTSPFIHNGDGKPLTQVKAGGEYFVRVETDRLQPCSVTVTYYFEQKIAGDPPTRILWYPYPLYEARATAGSSITDRFIVIPIYMKPGNYFLVRQAQYVCEGQTINRDFSIQVEITK